MLTRRNVFLVWGSAWMLSLIVLISAGLQMHAQRRATLDQASDDLRRLSSGAEVAINRTLLGMDALLASLPVQVARAVGPDGRMDPQAARGLLALATDRNLLLRDLALLSTDGRTLAAARPLAAGLDLRLDPALIEQARARRPASMVIGAPTRDEASSERTLVLVREVRLEQMPVLAVALVPASQVSALLAPQAALQDTTLTLERDDGTLMSSSPPMESMFGERLAAGPIAAAAADEVVESAGRLIATPSLVTQRPTLYPGLHVVAATRLDARLAPWSQSVLRTMGAVSAIVLLIVVAAMANQWQLARLDQARADASRSRNTLEQALGAMADGFLLCDAQDRVVVWNERYLEMHPWLRPVMAVGIPFDLLVRTASIALWPDPGDEARRVEWRKERLARHRNASLEFEQTLVDGEVLQVIERRTPDGGTVSVHRDITRGERALRQAKAAAETANDAKTRFLAAMSHEIRTPLNGVLGMNRLLRATPLTEEQQRFVGTIEASGRTLLALIDDVLDMSRIEAGRMELESLAFEPRQLIQEVVATLEPRAAEKHLALDVEWPSQLPTLRGDANRLRQILFNLLGNAIKFTDEGRVELLVRAEAESPARTRLHLMVRDTGVGIGPEVLPRLFERFVQADSSTARRFGGSGLGLAITHDLVQLMGGHIEVESLPGLGSTFTVDIPFALAAIGERPGDASWPLALLPPLRLLVAEDNDVNQMVIEAMLRQMGHHCEIVADGASAIARAGEGGWDCVLMDIQMPGMDGEQAARAIRAMPGERGRVPIIALTANALVEDHRRYLSIGMNGHVAKPIEPELLAQALARCVAASAAAHISM